MGDDVPDHRRSDARRNRETILEAARQLFADSADFPMTEVARRAGVGQGTLYRNFPDRSHLALAVMDDDVDHLEQLASRHNPDDPDALFVVLRATAETAARSNTLQELARGDINVDSAAERARQRVRGFMARPLRAAKAAGAVRPDLTVDDLLLVLWMIRGASLFTPDPVSRTATVTRALNLALQGIAPFHQPQVLQPRWDPEGQRN